MWFKFNSFQIRFIEIITGLIMSHSVLVYSYNSILIIIILANCRESCQEIIIISLYYTTLWCYIAELINRCEKRIDEDRKHNILTIVSAIKTVDLPYDTILLFGKTL